MPSQPFQCARRTSNFSRFLRGNGWECSIFVTKRWQYTVMVATEQTSWENVTRGCCDLCYLIVNEMLKYDCMLQDVLKFYEIDWWIDRYEPFQVANLLFMLVCWFLLYIVLILLCSLLSFCILWCFMVSLTDKLYIRWILAARTDELSLLWQSAFLGLFWLVWTLEANKLLLLLLLLPGNLDNIYDKLSFYYNAPCAYIFDGKFCNMFCLTSSFTLAMAVQVYAFHFSCMTLSWKPPDENVVDGTSAVSQISNKIVSMKSKKDADDLNSGAIIPFINATRYIDRTICNFAYQTWTRVHLNI